MNATEYFRQPHDVIVKKLELAELTISLGKVTQEKWRRHETMRDVLQEEERLLREIAVKAAELQEMVTKSEAE
jgi:hypothetical protein